MMSMAPYYDLFLDNGFDVVRLTVEGPLFMCYNSIEVPKFNGSITYLLSLITHIIVLLIDQHIQCCHYNR